jgi:RNA polymerase sigma factor (sigma-70 family)
MLNEISKRDKEWRLLARQITTTSNLPPYLADDFVNDMYIKLHAKKGNYNTSYIYLTLKSICYDYLRKQKETLELDYSIPISDEYCDTMNEIMSQLQKIPYNQRTICLMKQDKTFRELSKETDIKTSRVYNWYRKGIEEIKNNPKLKELYYEITRTG